jgi:branched-chain amino acid aminotransferase
MSDYYSINGQLVKAEEAKLHVTDLTLRRGYGAFDYLRIYRGQPLFIDDHLERFQHSADILGLELPMTKLQLKHHVAELIAKNATTEAGLQFFLTGGYSADGFTPTTANLLILQVPLPARSAELFERGCKLISYPYQRDLPEVKSTNYLMAIYLRKAMREAAASDVLYHSGGYALETTRSNLFIVTHEGQLITPASGILKGITRNHLLRLASASIPIEERPIKLAEVYAAREVFISSTIRGTLPVRQLDEQLIADGKPGPVTEQLMAQFREHVEAYLAITEQTMLIHS